MPTVFVQIASYRDADLIPTLRDCIGFAISRDRGSLSKQQRCVLGAPNAIQSLYTSETYTLQLDSHHRFIPGWDAALIEMLSRLHNSSAAAPH